MVLRRPPSNPHSESTAIAFYPRVLFESPQTPDNLRQPRLDRDHPAKNAHIDRWRAAHERIVVQIVMHAGLRDRARAVADFYMVGTSRLTSELAPLADRDRAGEAGLRRKP